MLFSSVIFVFLALPIVLVGYFILPKAARNTWLLLASIFFYAWGGLPYLPLLIGIIVMNYVFGLFVAEDRAPRARKTAVTLAVIGNLIVLGGFKYANFAVDNLNVLLVAAGHTPFVVAPVQLPIGISFFTFHSMSYVLDVYRNDAKVQRNPLRIALYLAFFPQLIAGPIVRYHQIADQFSDRKVTFDGFAYGVQRFIIGLGKKMLVANILAVPADEIFKLPVSELSTGLAWLGIVCYTLQIYFDFSGYSDMAIGLARMFGFHFLENFQWPYISQNIREFWRRWHISLSTWFRDYLYLPIGGNRRGNLITARNLVLVFFLCGLWHGASWNFVVWGLYHGAFLVLERTRIGTWLEALPRAFRHAYVLLVVMVGWVFFRATTLTGALRFLYAMAGLSTGKGAYHAIDFYFGEPSLIAALLVGIIGSAPWVIVVSRASAGKAAEGPVRLAAATACLLVLLLSSMALTSGTHNPFIYFRF